MTSQAGLGCIAFLGLVGLVGCEPEPAPKTTAPAPVLKIDLASATPGNLWPIKKGNEWIYDVDRLGAVQATKLTALRSIDSASSADGLTATIGVFENPGQHESEIERGEYKASSDGLYQLSSQMSKVPMTPPRQLVKLPLQAGDKQTQTLTSGAPGSSLPQAQSISTLSKGVETVDTGIGRMEAFVVESVSKYKIDKVSVTATTTTYWVPRIGPVRLVIETNFSNGSRQQDIWRLKRHNITNP